MEDTTEIVKGSEERYHRTIEQYYKGAGSVRIPPYLPSDTKEPFLRIYNIYRSDSRQIEGPVKNTNEEYEKPRILELLEGTRKKIDDETGKFNNNVINLETVKANTQRTIYELSQYNPKHLILEITYEDSVYIKALFEDFNLYLEIVFEEKEEIYMFSLYKQKTCIASFEGQKEETYFRIKREIQKVRTAKYRKTVSSFNSSVYNNAISQSSTASRGI